VASGVLISMIISMERIKQMFGKKSEDLGGVVGQVERGPFHLRSVAGGRRFHRKCGKEFGAAKQEFLEEADINRIMAKYRQTGVVQVASQMPPQFGEDVGFKTYAEAHEALKVAQEQFLKLPPEIRLELGNDPGRYREVSSQEGLRAVVERIGARQRKRLEQAQALVASNAPKPPTPPPGADSAPKPPVGGVTP